MFKKSATKMVTVLRINYRLDMAQSQKNSAAAAAPSDVDDVFQAKGNQNVHVRKFKKMQFAKLFFQSKDKI